MEKKILILPGDGIGQEVTSSMNEVLNYLIDEQGLDYHIYAVSYTHLTLPTKA